MKWVIGKPSKRYRCWRMWFAWYPVTCVRTNRVVWLEHVERYLAGPFDGVNRWYRELSDTDNSLYPLR